MFKYDVCAIGGCGRVGLPLSIAFADRGLNVAIYDLDKNRISQVTGGEMPFMEEGCDIKLKKVIGKTLHASDSPRVISQAQFIMVTIGTPVDEHLNPQYSGMVRFFESITKYLVPGQHIILRSTVYPGTSEKISDFLGKRNMKVHISFCPERIAEGKALEELESLPQIVSGFDGESIEAVSTLFRRLTKDVIILEPIEAELAKLFTNSWRYVQFAIANQFYMLANRYDIDYYRIHNAMTYKYPRTQDLPRPGFAAGPCLFKDTMQLAAFSNNMFYLGHSAMLVNEGLPNYLVDRLKSETQLSDKSVGILGMAFKGNSDDERDSLSFKLKRILEIEAGTVYCSDPYVKRDYFITHIELIQRCDIIILAAPHDQYKSLKIPETKMLVDIWNFYNKQGAIL